MHRQCPALLLPGTKGQATLFHFSFHYMFSCQQRDHEPLVSFSCLVFQTLGARTLLGHSPYLGSFRFRAFLDLFFFFLCSHQEPRLLALRSPVCSVCGLVILSCIFGLLPRKPFPHLAYLEKYCASLQVLWKSSRQNEEGLFLATLATHSFALCFPMANEPSETKRACSLSF